VFGATIWINSIIFVRKTIYKKKVKHIIRKDNSSKPKGRTFKDNKNFSFSSNVKGIVSPSNGSKTLYEIK
jgi:hypothetical protein